MDHAVVLIVSLLGDLTSPLYQEQRKPVQACAAWASLPKDKNRMR